MSTADKINEIILKRYPNDYAGRKNMALRQLHAEMRQQLGEEKFLQYLEQQENENPRPKYEISEEIKQAAIKDDRDYAIRKGRILERFTQDFHTRHKNSNLYRNVYESLIRDADPYEIIERLIEINADQFALIQDMTPWISPGYAQHKQNQGK